MNRRELMSRMTVAITAPGALVAGCGGGGAETGGGTQSGVLTAAASYSQFVSALFTDSTSRSQLAAYDNDFSAFGAPAENITQGTSPFESGLYTNIAAANYPDTPNGRFRITRDASIPRHGVCNAVDLINGVVGNGLSQSFYGVKAVTADSRVMADGRSLTNADVVLIVELIASFQGVDLYRGVQVFRGFVYNWDTVNSNADYASGTLLFHGSYVLNNVQVINQTSETPPLGIVESYEDYVQISVLA